MPPIHHFYLCSINHPSFTRVSPTTYLIKQLDYPILLSIHVAQIAKYIQFDKLIWEDDNASHYQSVPIGFYDFYNAWNSSIAPDDPHRFSTFYYAEDLAQNTIFPSPYPVQLHEFYITPAQANATHSNSNQMFNSLQSDINQEFATIMVAKQKKEHQSFEERKQRCTCIFKKNIPSYYPPSLGSNITCKHGLTPKRSTAPQANPPPAASVSPASPNLAIETCKTTVVPLPIDKISSSSSTHMEV